jgi:hypothetical protein
MKENVKWKFSFLPQMPPRVLMNFMVFPPGCGESVTDV